MWKLFPQKIWIWKLTLDNFTPELDRIHKEIPPNQSKILIADKVYELIVQKVEALEEYQKKLDNL